MKFISLLLITIEMRLYLYIGASLTLVASSGAFFWSSQAARQEIEAGTTLMESRSDDFSGTQVSSQNIGTIPPEEVDLIRRNMGK